jgi:NAD(P)-dependent dehydrogenase (short-subunit alcohol dehydrogenase family)
MRDAGRLAVVTGGAGGIGSAICHALAADGFDVIAADLTPPAAPLAGGVHFEQLDVTVDDDWRRLASRVVSSPNTLTCIVNCAYSIIP